MGSTVASIEPSEAADAITATEQYLRSYLSFPDDRYYLPLTLLAALLQQWQDFDEIPQLSVTGQTSGSGKTRVIQLIHNLLGGDMPRSKSVILTGNTTFAAMRYKVEEGLVLCLDECEQILHNKQYLPLLNTYKRGSYAYKMVGAQPVKFDAFGPRLFATIGDVHPVLRERCIIIPMVRMTALKGRKVYDRRATMLEGIKLGRHLDEMMMDTIDEIKHIYHHYTSLYPALNFLGDRDRELWTPLFSVARVLCPHRCGELASDAVRISTNKTLPRRKSYDESAELAAREEEYGMRLLRDLYYVMSEDEKLPTMECITRLRNYSLGAWQDYEGKGITPDPAGAKLMAKLLSYYDVSSTVIRVASKDKAESTKNGYIKQDLVDAAQKHGISLPIRRRK